jgi:hypothetical protein
VPRVDHGRKGNQFSRPIRARSVTKIKHASAIASSEPALARSDRVRGGAPPSRLRT